MKTIRIHVLSALCVASAFGFASVASAQSGSYGPAIRNGNNGTPAIYHHASTLEEGVLRGGADLLRGIGDMNYSNSLAMINGQEARRRSIENHKQYVETFFEVRKINREARAQTQKPRVTVEELTRIARERAPKALAAHNFNATTGGLAWPVALQGAEFAADRAAVDALVGKSKNREVRQLASEMTEKLQERVKETNPSEYVAAKKFLTGLSVHDGSMPSTLASR